MLSPRHKLGWLGGGGAMCVRLSDCAKHSTSAVEKTIDRGVSALSAKNLSNMCGRYLYTFGSCANSDTLLSASTMYDSEVFEELGSSRRGCPFF